MQKHDLANQLRDRQREYGVVDRDVIDTVSDDAMIESYLTPRQLKAIDLDVVVAVAESVESFLDVLASVK